MDIGHYKYQASNAFQSYDFFSQGPNGQIRKVVRFTLVKVQQFTYYNLGFGDWSTTEDRIDDFAVSNNLDAERVLATIANIVTNFTNHYPDIPIFAQGSTPSRTRLYQMNINKHWDKIEPIFKLYGFVENEGFQPFESGRNYQSFFAYRK